MEAEKLNALQMNSNIVTSEQNGSIIVLVFLWPAVYLGATVTVNKTMSENNKVIL